jgi:hypothetical protein
MKTKMLELPDTDDSWAIVELYRWQHGKLPGMDGTPELPLDESAALRGMAAAIEKGDKYHFPSPYNVCQVLRYVAKRLEASTPNDKDVQPRERQ